MIFLSLCPPSKHKEKRNFSRQRWMQTLTNMYLGVFKANIQGVSRTNIQWGEKLCTGRIGIGSSVIFLCKEINLKFLR